MCHMLLSCRYDQLADYVFGRGKGKKILLPFQIAVLLGIAITYTVVGGDSLYAFTKLVDPGSSVPKWGFYIAFGGIQLLLSLVSHLPVTTARMLLCFSRPRQLGK